MSHNNSRPGAMSLLDKYAQINANIDEARRRVASTRSELETTNQSIENLREEREAMEIETGTARDELHRFEDELKRVENEYRLRVEEKKKVEGEYRLARWEGNDTRRQMDLDRLAFLERCREFRSACKRMRVAATLLVLDGGGGLNEGEGDVWRRLQDEDLDSDEDGEKNAIGRRGKKKKSDDEMERVIKDEKECRAAFIEAECALHAARSEQDGAVQRCNDRNQKLTQQRAQLERHRREVDELEREIGQVNDEIVKANQDARSYENAWKRGQTSSTNSYSGNISNNGSYSRHFNPPSNNNNRTPLYNSSSSNSYSYGGSSNTGTVSNPYKSKPSNPYQNRSTMNQETSNARSTTSHQYASEMLQNNDNGRGISGQQTQSYGSSQHQNQPYSSSGQNQNRTWSNARNHRQFGTAVDISVDYSASTSPKFTSSKPSSNRVSLGTPATFTGDDESSASSSSSDDEIISFDIFGKGK